MSKNNNSEPVSLAFIVGGIGSLIGAIVSAHSTATDLMFFGGVALVVAGILLYGRG